VQEGERAHLDLIFIPDLIFARQCLSKELCRFPSVLCSLPTLILIITKNSGWKQFDDRVAYHHWSVTRALKNANTNNTKLTQKNTSLENVKCIGKKM